MLLETSSWCRTGGQITGSLLRVEENHPVELNIYHVGEGHGSVVTPSQPHLANAWRMDVCLPTVKRALGAWPEREGEGICRGEDRGLWLPPSMLCRTSLRALHGVGRELLWGSFVRAVSDVYPSPLSLQAHTPRCLDGLDDIGCGPGPQPRLGPQPGWLSQSTGCSPGDLAGGLSESVPTLTGLMADT